MNTNIVKFIKGLFLMFAAGVLWYACEEEPIGQQPLESDPPGSVSNVKVMNVPGGAVLSYQLPKDEDLLYVKAVYERNGEICESRTSLYRDTLKVAGFGDTEPHEVRLIAVDRSQNESPPAIATIEPLEPPVLSIGNSLELTTYFGGVDVAWDNPSGAEVMLNVTIYSDSLQEYVPLETFYVSSKSGRRGIREMDTIPYKLGVFVQDLWGNLSEQKYYELTPFFEREFDREKFSNSALSNDGPHETNNLGNWAPQYMWDGRWGEDRGYSSKASADFPLPQSITVDLGTLGVISRIRIYQRDVKGPGGSWESRFEAGNPRIFEVWGREELDLTGDWNLWTKLMECESIKPSGLPAGQYSEEDLAIVANGEDFYNLKLDVKVRYIRFRVYKPWSPVDQNFQITEFKVFGDDR